MEMAVKIEGRVVFQRCGDIVGGRDNVQGLLPDAYSKDLVASLVLVSRIKLVHSTSSYSR